MDGTEENEEGADGADKNVGFEHSTASHRLPWECLVFQYAILDMKKGLYFYRHEGKVSRDKVTVS